MIKRMCWWGKIKPDRIAEYKASHQPVWPELLDVYRQNGIVKISCFLRGNDLLVYTEYDEEVYLKGGREAIGRTDVARRWDTRMRDFALPDYTALEFEEVFRME